jgi:hypothetical protein
MSELDLSKLKEPFAPTDIEWRVGRVGKNERGIWATCFAYLTNRAIMDRLDDVAGPGNWRNEYKEAPAGGVLCGLSVRVAGEWVTKWDGAENTDLEAVKGGLSVSMKRAAVQWGIGRYLYDLPEGFAIINSNGRFHGKTKDNATFRWSPPELPAWALPKGAGKPTEVVDRKTGEVQDEPEEYLSEFQVNDIRERLKNTGSDEKKFLVHMRAPSVERILAASYDDAVRALDAKAAANAQAGATKPKAVAK